MRAGGEEERAGGEEVRVGGRCVRRTREQRSGANPSQKSQHLS